MACNVVVVRRPDIAKKGGSATIPLVLKHVGACSLELVPLRAIAKQTWVIYDGRKESTDGGKDKEAGS